MTDYIPQNYINQALVLFGMLALCVGAVTMLSWTKDLLFSACRVVRKILTFSKGK